MIINEGVFSELVSNVLIVGLIKFYCFGKLFKGKKIVVILIGNGFKDFDIVIFFLDNFI